MYFHNSLIPSSPRGAYFLLPLESKQEATSGWNFTKCISETKVNQLKVKNIPVKMGISIFLSFKFQKYFSSLRIWPKIVTKWLKGLSVIASGSEKSSNLSEIKKNTCQSQHVPFFLKQLHKFDRKMAFSSDFIPWVLSTVSVHRKVPKILQ